MPGSPRPNENSVKCTQQSKREPHPVPYQLTPLHEISEDGTPDMVAQSDGVGSRSPPLEIKQRIVKLVEEIATDLKANQCSVKKLVNPSPASQISKGKTKRVTSRMSGEYVIGSLRPPNREVKQFLPAKVNGVEVLALVDSGNLFRTVISQNFLEQLGFSVKDLVPLPASVSLSTAKEGQQLEILGETKHDLHLYLGGGRTRFRFRPVVLRDLNMPLNLSAYFLKKHSMDQLHGTGRLRVQGREYQLVAQGRVPETELSSLLEGPVVMAEEVTVPPHSQVPAYVRAEGVPQSVCACAVQGSFSFMDKYDLHPVRSAVTEFREGRAMISILNTTDESKTVPAGAEFGEYQALSETPEEKSLYPYRICVMAQERPARRAFRSENLS